MKNPGAAARSLQLLRGLEEILTTEGGRNWLPGIRSARHAGESGVAKGDETSAMREMGQIYRSMQAGPGGFGDFFVWRSGYAERVDANRELKRVKEELWELLGEP